MNHLIAKRLIPLFIIITLVIQISFVSAQPQHRYTMSYVFDNRGSTPVELSQDDISIPLFLKTQWQQVKIVSSTPTLGSTYLDEDGNEMVLAGLSQNIPPKSKVSFSVTFEIESKDEIKPQIDPGKAGLASEIPQQLINEYTGATTNFMASDPMIASLAKSLTKDKSTVLSKVTRLINWFNVNVSYDNYEVPRFANETLIQKKGDCDDQSILLISMLRSLGIPSYLEVGIVISSRLDARETSWDGHLEVDAKGVGWHGWAMVYIPPYGWLPVDLTLIDNDDPLEVIRNAPEFGASVVTCLKISKQDYVSVSRSTRQRIINSDVYVQLKDQMESITTPFWLNPTIILLAVVIAGAIIFMYISARRSQPFREVKTI